MNQQGASFPASDTPAKWDDKLNIVSDFKACVIELVMYAYILCVFSSFSFPPVFTLGLYLYNVSESVSQ